MLSRQLSTGLLVCQLLEVWHVLWLLSCASGQLDHANVNAFPLAQTTLVIKATMLLSMMGTCSSAMLPPALLVAATIRVFATDIANST